MKKGFTLVELLAVIVIISLLSVLAYDGILKKGNELKDLSNARYRELLKTSAKMYVNAKSDVQMKLKAGQTIKISYKELQEAGYLSEDLKNLNNSNVDVNSSCIQVEYKYNDYSYIYTLVNCN